MTGPERRALLFPEWGVRVLVALQKPEVVMSHRHGKILAGFALVIGLGTLAMRGEAFAASKEAEARKYHELLKSAKDSKTKILALDELGKLGLISRELTEKALPDIAKALKDKDAAVRVAAAEALGKCDPDPADAVPALLDLVKNDKEEKVKIAAMNGLALMRDKAREATSALKDVQKANDKKSKLYKSAGDAINSISGKTKK